MTKTEFDELTEFIHNHPDLKYSEGPTPDQVFDVLECVRQWMVTNKAYFAYGDDTIYATEESEPDPDTNLDKPSW